MRLTNLIACVGIVIVAVWMAHTRDFRRRSGYRPMADRALQALEQLKADVNANAAPQIYQDHLAQAQSAVDKLAGRNEQSAVHMRQTVFIYDLAGKLRDSVNNAKTPEERQQRLDNMRQLDETDTAAFALAQAEDALKAGQ